MKNHLPIPDIKFTFETEEEYHGARSTGYIDTYDMARICRRDYKAYTVDYPVHSRESFIEEIKKYVDNEDAEFVKIYPSTHSYDINDYQ